MKKKERQSTKQNSEFSYVIVLINFFKSNDKKLTFFITKNDGFIGTKVKKL
jgi:hypothetical protein